MTGAAEAGVGLDLKDIGEGTHKLRRATQDMGNKGEVSVLGDPIWMAWRMVFDIH